MIFRCTNCGCHLVQEVSIHDLLCRDCDLDPGEYVDEDSLDAEDASDDVPQAYPWSEAALKKYPGLRKR